jgi:hypothetical protein
MPEIKQALSSKLIWALAGMPFGAGQELVRVVSLELRKFSNADSRPGEGRIAGIQPAYQATPASLAANSCRDDLSSAGCTRSF